MYLVECITPKGPCEPKAIGVKELSTAPTKLDDSKAEVQDDLREINLSSTENLWVTCQC